MTSSGKVIKELKTRVSRDSVRELAEDVRSHAMQMRACAPGASGEQVRRDALLLTAQNMGVAAEEVEGRIKSWREEIAGDPVARCYDKALAHWLAGDMEQALTLAVLAAQEAEERARRAGSPEELARAASQETILAAREAAEEKRQAWMLAGHIEYEQGRLPEALAASRSALGAALYNVNPLTWVEAASQVAWILDEQGNRCEAEPLMRSILRVMERTLGPNSPEVAASLNNLGRLLRETGRLEKAEFLYRRALTIAENACGEHHPQVAICLNNLAGLLRSLGRPADAEPLLRRALEIDEANYGRNHPAVALGFNNLGSLLHEMERSEEAAVCFREALEIDENASSPDRPTVAADLENLAIVLHSLQRHSEAESLLRRSIGLAEQLHGRGHHSVAFGLTHLSLLLCDMNRHNEAGALAREAVKLSLDIARTDGRPAPGTRFVGEAYRRMLTRLGIPDEEMPSIIFMINKELDHEGNSPVRPSSHWLEDVLGEMGIAQDQEGGGGACFLS
ncbi:MAG TPA: tetratricopeptide repeat protein [Verrucomicrobiales bacterium]|jgi:tetratricopeptide (TPR) repeat protein|nr:tetratricopeptide repeat protein [Verrucomicrobiales bacterium]